MKQETESAQAKVRSDINEVAVVGEIVACELRSVLTLETSAYIVKTYMQNLYTVFSVHPPNWGYPMREKALETSACAL